MSKTILILFGLALTLLPAQLAAQEVGASFRVREAVAQPGFTTDQAEQAGLRAFVPAGWAYSVSRGLGGGAGSARVATGLAESDTLAVPLPETTLTADTEQPVTWTFVPL